MGSGQSKYKGPEESVVNCTTKSYKEQQSQADWSIEDSHEKGKDPEGTDMVLGPEKSLEEPQTQSHRRPFRDTVRSEKS
jgi:hypothetical protein